MKQLLTNQVGIAWLLIVCVSAAALLVLFKVAVLDAPPSNAVLISAVTPPATTPQISLTTPAGIASLSQPPPTKTLFSEILAATAFPPSATPAAATPTPESVVVYVSGAVNSPG